MVMNPRNGLIAFAGFITCAVTFHSYGMSRTMCETVGFDITAALKGFLFSGMLPLVALLSAVLAMKYFKFGRTYITWLLAIAFLLPLTCVASEIWILSDEARFAAEVSKARPATAYGRPRAWPNQGCSLVFVPGAGIHSTD